MKEFKYKEITEKIIGAAMKVHLTLGTGFREIIYQRTMALQMEADGLLFIRECNMHVYYLEKQIGERRVDFFVENKICTELKAIQKLEPVNFAQARNYLEAFNKEVGLLINFGSISLEFKRLENPKYNPALIRHPALSELSQKSL
ncbi:MAG: GxxExxY protein [Parafilimonas sp.]